MTNSNYMLYILVGWNFVNSIEYLIVFFTSLICWHWRLTNGCDIFGKRLQRCVTLIKLSLPLPLLLAVSYKSSADCLNFVTSLSWLLTDDIKHLPQRWKDNEINSTGALCSNQSRQLFVSLDWLKGLIIILKSWRQSLAHPLGHRVILASCHIVTVFQK